MERSRKIFRKIVSAANQVITIANDYADSQDSNRVSRFHFQLEDDMQRIAVTCDCLAGVLDKPRSERDPAVDVRIRDWMSTDDPQECLDTLNRMARLLQQLDGGAPVSRVSLIPSRTTGRLGGPAGMQDRIKEAVDLFHRKGCFHFLCSAEVWDNEKPVGKQYDVSRPRDGVITEVVSAGELPVHATSQRSRELKSEEQKKVEEKKLEEILKWIDGLNCAEKQDATLSLRQEDTCKWLFNTSQYRMWRCAGSGSLWLRGKPGAGKSVLVSFVIDSFKKARREGDIFAFFYCDFRNERSTSSAEVLRSILSQLLRQLRDRSVDLGTLLEALMEAKEWGGGTLGDAKELTGFVSRVAGLFTRKPVVIVDALDECKDVQKLIQALAAIKDHVRLFVASRPLRVIMDELSGLPFVSTEDMADELSMDIALHVTREMDVRRRLRDLDAVLKTEIHTVLCDKADGMFRWVQCSIDALDRCVTRKEVREALHNLPTGLDETYERILLAIDTEPLAGRLAQRALGWLVAALRPLQLSEIMEALSVNLQRRALDLDLGPMHSGALLDACGSLVTYTEKTGVIILSHFSVKEYLMGKCTRTNLEPYHVNLERAHLLLVRSCMCYMSICLKQAQGPPLADIPRPTRVSSQHLVRLHPKLHPLLDYALDDALGHFEHLGSIFELALPDVIVLAKDIQRHSWVWDNVCIPARRLGWETETVKPCWPPAAHDLLLYILVAFASNSLLSAYFRRTVLNPKDGTNPLVYAVYFGKDNHARTLLSLGARLNYRGWEIDRYRRSLPIEVAFYRQHYGMVAYLVEEGCILPPHIFTYSFNLGVPVIFFDRVPAFIAKLLIQADDFLENANDCFNESAVYVTETLNRLITQSGITEQDLIVFTRRFVQIVDEHSTMESIRLALFRFAVAQGYISAARYLLAIGTRVPPDLLVQLHHYPGKWKTAPIIRFLVDSGADVLARTWSKDSVLHTVLWAADPSGSHYLADNDVNESDILEVAKLLVELGCDPFEGDCHGKGLLQLAVERGYISVARYLLDIGAHPPSDFLVTLESGGFYRTRRIAATIRLLVESGADALVRTSDGESLLHVILRSFGDDDDKEALEATSVLVRYGCDLLEDDIHGKTPLQISIERGCISVAQHLLTLGAHLPPDFPVTLKLDWSCRRIAPMIRLLLESGINALAHTSDGDSLLHVILGPRMRYIDDDNENDDLEAARALVEYGCDPLEVDSSGKTPLHLAVEEQRISVVRYLLALGAHPPPDFLLTLKADWWRWSMAPMIRLLVENGANPLARTSDGDSLLHIVLQSSDSDEKALEAARLLIGYGCNLLEVDSHGKTPLQIAVAQNHISVARYILTQGAHPLSDFFVTLENDQQYQSIASMVRSLVENGANALVHTSGDGDPLLHVMLRALDNGNDALEVTKLLVGYGCDPLEATPRGKTALHIAVEQFHVSVARYLITLGVRPPADFFITLEDNWCRWRRVAPIIRLLVENGANALVHTSDGDSLLHIVLQSLRGDEEALEAVRLLVEYGCDPLEANSHENTPLQIAVEYGYISVARYLLTLGAPLPFDFTAPLGSHQWYQSKAPMLRLLVGYGTNILAHTDDGDSLLHVVLQSSMNDENALEEARILVGYGCDIHETNVHEETPLHIAVEQQYISVARYLLTLGARPPPDFFIKLGRHWWHRSKAPVIRLLVENGASALARTVDGDSLLHVVLQTSEDDSKTLEVAKALVGYGCDPLEVDSRGKAPLQIAAERGYTSVAQYLLSFGTQPLPDILVILQCNWWGRSVAPMIRLLAENGANVLAHTSDGDSFLHVMLRSSDNDSKALQAARVLVKYGCNPLGTNSRGETPLHIAAGRSYLSVARYLITRGASVLTKTHNGDTVLHAAAASSGHRYLQRYDCAIEVVKCLVKHGCDPAVSNNNGKTPLHHAVDIGHTKTMKYLLSLILPPRDILFTAIQSVRNADCCRDIVETLVASGCDTQTRNSDGDTVLQAAIKKEKADVVEYLFSVLSSDNLSFEDPLPAAALAPSSVQSEMRRAVTDRRSRSASLELPTAKRIKHS